VKNTGRVAGAAVAQIYVGEQSPSVPRPAYELKGFQKVELQPNETRQLSFTLDRRSFAFWSDKTKSWQVDPAHFTIYAGDSSEHLPLKQEVTLH